MSKLARRVVKMKKVEGKWVLVISFISILFLFVCLFGWLEGKEEKIREGNDGAVEEIGGEYVYIIEIYRVEESEVNICR